VDDLTLTTSGCTTDKCVMHVQQRQDNAAQYVSASSLTSILMQSTTHLCGRMPTCYSMCGHNTKGIAQEVRAQLGVAKLSRQR
jgi:hypothetical protein